MFSWGLLGDRYYNEYKVVGNKNGSRISRDVWVEIVGHGGLWYEDLEWYDYKSPYYSPAPVHPSASSSGVGGECVVH